METRENNPGCPAESCPQCPHGREREGSQEPQPTVAGGRLAVAAVVIFLLPLGLAIAGGLLAEAMGWVAAAGALLGAGAGVVVALAARRPLFSIKEGA